MIFNTHETIDMCYMHDTYNLVRLPHPPEGAMGRFHFAGEIIGNAPSPGHRTEGRRFGRNRSLECRAVYRT